MSKNNKTAKLAKTLTPKERDMYKAIGEPDYEQNHLELFTGIVISDLMAIMSSCSDNQAKSDVMTDYLKDLGFIRVGVGTNILCMRSATYPGVVFKIALDDCGIADNFNDDILSHNIPEYNEVLTRDVSGMVSVQLFKVCFKDTKRFSNFIHEALKLIKRLSKNYLVCDLSLDMFQNFCVERDGSLGIADGSDLYPLSPTKDLLRCIATVGEKRHTGEAVKCKGELKYTENYRYVVCEKCGRQFNPLELRPKKEAKEMLLINDGMDEDKREELERSMERALGWGEMKSIYQNPSDTTATPDISKTVSDIEVTTTMVRARVETQSPFYSSSDEEDQDDKDTSEDCIPYGELETESNPPDTDQNKSYAAVHAESGENIAYVDKRGDGNDTVSNWRSLQAIPVSKPQTIENLPESRETRVIFTSSSQDNGDFDEEDITTVADNQDDRDEDDFQVLIPVKKDKPIHALETDVDKPDPIRGRDYINVRLDTSIDGGLYIDIHGDPERALELEVVPLKVSTDGGRTYNTIFATDTVKTMIFNQIQRMQDNDDWDEDE